MKKKIKRLHSEDARFLRNMFYDLIARMNELEEHMGAIQHHLKIDNPLTPNNDSSLPENHTPRSEPENRGQA